MSREEIINDQNAKCYFKAIYKGATWKIGTKSDPKKELGILNFCVEIPKNDGTKYIKDITEMVFDKECFPKGKMENFCEVILEYDRNMFNPEGKMRFIRVVE